MLMGINLLPFSFVCGRRHTRVQTELPAFQSAGYDPNGKPEMLEK